MEKKITQPWQKGLIISLVLIVISLGVQFADLSQNKGVQWAQLGLMMAAIVWSCFSFGKEMDGQVTFGNVFAHGFKTTATLTVIIILFSIVSIKFLFPEMVDQALEQARVEMEKNDKLTEANINDGLAMTKKFFLPFAIGGILFMYAILGALASLVGAAITKKNPNPTPFDAAA